MEEDFHTPHTVQIDVNQMTDTELENYDIFTPDDEYFTPPQGLSVTTQSLTHSQKEYVSCTLNSSNQARRTILPTFPPRSSIKPTNQTTATTTISSAHSHINEEVDFLLCNVPRQLLTLEQYQRRQKNIYISAFEIGTWDEIRRRNYQSFMVTFHKNIYIQLGQKWHIDTPILDYNLARLHQCAIKNGFHFLLNELPLALEFYLQMDTDIFHLKTCSFRQGQPRTVVHKNGQQSYEGIFTMDRQSIVGRYGLAPCNRNTCICCKNQSASVQFDPKQIHRFLNQYQAVLNCPVTCTTSNIIYALTCPCGEKDYVAHTNLPFVDCLAYHSREIARSIREFLFGDINANILELTPKSEETKTNDKNWLYQHAPRCPAIMQIFLDRNPSYWCFVPIPTDRTLRASTFAPQQQLPMPPLGQITTVVTPLPFERRNNTLSMRLANNVPRPTGEYVFKLEQFNEQKQFFKYGKDRDPINIFKLTFYNPAIVAVLPDHCSDTIKQFITSLFITHGECQLNKSGRLINQQFFHGYPARGQWYHGLTRRPSLSMIY